MTIKQLYKIIREDGGITISPEMPTGTQYENGGVRLIADEGKILKKGEILTQCIDTDSAEGWEEIDYIEPEE